MNVHDSIRLANKIVNLTKKFVKDYKELVHSLDCDTRSKFDDLVLNVLNGEIKK